METNPFFYFLHQHRKIATVICQLSAKSLSTTTKTRPQFTHRQTTNFLVTNYQFLGGKLPSSLSRAPAAMSANHKYTLQNGNRSMHSRILHRQSANQS